MQSLIDSTSKQIKNLESALQYASGQSYYNDKRKIQELKAELHRLELKQHREEEAKSGMI